jgi:hypothetical protein
MLYCTVRRVRGGRGFVSRSMMITPKPEFSQNQELLLNN